MKTIYYSKSGKKPSIKFVGLNADNGASVNDFRKVAEEVFDAINLAAKQCELRKTHSGKAMTFNFSGSGEDDYGTYKLWRFPVFVRNKNELVITIKVWTDAVHGGSCIMWCPAYNFTDLPSAAQFGVQLNTALQHADAQAKKYTRLNLPKGG